MAEPSILVTGVRVIDLFSPIPVGGTLAIGGDAGAGVNVVSMEVMQNLCRRYGARASLSTTPHEPFSEANVRTWIGRLNVGGCVERISAGSRAEIAIASGTSHVATLLPFVEDASAAGALVTIRRTVMESGRLPAVEVQESWSKLAEAGEGSLAARARAALHAGNRDLDQYLAQPFFVAEPWSSKPGELTEREELLAEVDALLESG